MPGIALKAKLISVVVILLVGASLYLGYLAHKLANLNEAEDIISHEVADDLKKLSIDIDMLGKFINLRIRPASVLWKTEEAPGGRDWSLTAR